MNIPIPTIRFAPPAPPPSGQSREWMDKLAQCAVSCAKTMETRRVKANEAPIVMGSLCLALSDHSGIPLETVLEMVATAARGLRSETPETPSAVEVAKGMPVLYAPGDLEKDTAAAQDAAIAFFENAEKKGLPPHAVGAVITMIVFAHITAEERELEWVLGFLRGGVGHLIRNDQIQQGPVS